MEVCPATPLLSRSSAVPIHWHSGFRVQRRQDHQLHDEFLDHLLHDGNSHGTTDKSNVMNIALAVLLSRRHVQDPILVDVESYFNLRQATRCWREPNEMELPKRILVPSHHALTMKTWIRTPGWLSAYIENVCPFFVGKMVLHSMSFVMTTPAVSKPTDKGVTSNTSHTAPGSSPASPLSSRSSPPHSQVATRRTPDFSGASGHSTHCCAGRLVAPASDRRTR